MSGRATEVNKLVRQLRKAGCTIATTGRHHKVTLPNGNQVTIPVTPSDHRALKNALAQLRRSGLDLTPRHKGQR